ncbi:MAG TPA: bifunctional protein-serine/threonine kinase/phosphatase [Gammaproteobacteria bacterium]|nr:bifunctional protein-serine/threonine kinase/phosphatase [Gammaproteobacteria bacterium]
MKISVGQYSDKGRKETNQDFHGVCTPAEPLLSSKGIAIALADGISSSELSQAASRAAVTGFLEDYFCTSEAWSVKKSAECVLKAINSWLYSQTQQSQYRYDKDRGYVCTLSAMVIKSTMAHLFHVGDARIYRLRDGSLEQLTNDHRVRISREESYLGRALGISPLLEPDYRALQVEEGDFFLFATDGAYECASPQFIKNLLNGSVRDLEYAAKAIVAEAYEKGSTDNLTVQVIRIDELPDQDASSLYHQLSELPLPPLLEARMMFDGFRIIRELHASSRSHVYLATDGVTDAPIIIKIPSIDLRGDKSYLERFMLEEWVARRINSEYVLKPCLQTRKRNYLYTVTEFIDGQTLTQWMIDNPRPDLETVRGIVEQIAKGLRAFHRMEMLHQDLRPANIMIDKTGTVKIIDFGSTRVAGIEEIIGAERNPLGTAQYTAPEYFLGEEGTIRSDLFSLGVIAYQMLSGRLPYGARVARARTRSAQHKLKYDSLLNDDRDIPAWVDGVIGKAVHPDPLKRYGELSEFIYDLRHPNKEFVSIRSRPLLERNPVRFWQGVSFVLAVIIAILLIK